MTGDDKSKKTHKVRRYLRSQERAFHAVAFEQCLNGERDHAYVDIWGKGFQAQGIASAKALR